MEGPEGQGGGVSHEHDNEYYDDPALYRVMYADWTADVPPLLERMRAAGGPVLEVCCGNGRVLIPALESGIDADGLDLSPAMLADLESRLAAKGLRTGVHRGDMRAFSLPRRYAMVVVAFNSFLHNLTQADQLATLSCCRAHLAPGGRLLMCVFHPDVQKLIHYAGPEQLMKDLANVDGPGRVRLFDACVDDRIEQVREVKRRVEFVDEAGRVVREERLGFKLRYVFKPELELLLRAAGFGRWTIEPFVAGERGGGTFVAGRAPQEGDILLWTAWQD